MLMLLFQFIPPSPPPLLCGLLSAPWHQLFPLLESSQLSFHRTIFLLRAQLPYHDLAPVSTYWITPFYFPYLYYFMYFLDHFVCICVCIFSRTNVAWEVSFLGQYNIPGISSNHDTWVLTIYLWNEWIEVEKIDGDFFHKKESEFVFYNVNDIRL